MWNQGGQDFGGGGFLNTSNQFASPAGGTPGERKTVRRSQNLVPLSIRQILESPEDGLKIGEVEVHLATVIGLVVSVDTASTKVTFMVDDHTGVIPAVHWVEDELEQFMRRHDDVVENTYCRVTGSIRHQQGSPQFMVFNIRGIKDVNEITYHLLDVIHTDLKLKQIKPKQENAANMGDTSMQFGVGVGNSYGEMADSMTPQQSMVFRMIQGNTAPNGIARKDLQQMLRGKVSPQDVDIILEFLSGEGHIYTTSDDDHFQPTDS